MAKTTSIFVSSKRQTLKVNIPQHTYDRINAVADELNAREQGLVFPIDAICTEALNQALSKAEAELKQSA